MGETGARPRTNHHAISRGDGTRWLDEQFAPSGWSLSRGQVDPAYLILAIAWRDLEPTAPPDEIPSNFARRAPARRAADRHLAVAMRAGLADPTLRRCRCSRKRSGRNVVARSSCGDRGWLSIYAWTQVCRDGCFGVQHSTDKGRAAEAMAIAGIAAHKRPKIERSRVKTGPRAGRRATQNLRPRRDALIRWLAR